MEMPNPFDAEAIGKVIGGIVAAVTAGILFLRRYLANDAATRANDIGVVDTIERYRSLLDSEREARRVAEERADKFARELRDAIHQMGELKAEIARLSQHVESQGARIGEQSATIERLRQRLETGE